MLRITNTRAAIFLFALLLALLQAAALAAQPAAQPATQPAAPADAVAADFANDRAIARRLGARLGAIGGLQRVEATVVEGVVILEGEALSEDQRKLAEVIAAQMQGVSKVENRITLSSRLRDRFQVALDVAGDKLLRLVAATPLLLVALLIVWLSTRIGRTVSQRPRWVRLRLRSSNPYMEGLVQRLLRWVIVLAGVLLALDLLGATALVGAVLGSAGVVGLVLGFAFKDIAENYVAGILLSLRRPFSPGDHLVIDRLHEGKVVALTARSTLLMTLDGNELTLPNAVVFRSVVLNYTRNPKRRFDFLVPLDPSSSVGDAQREGLAAIARVDGVLADPAPYALVQEYLPDRLAVQFLGWVDQARNSHMRVRSEAMRAAKTVLDRAGIRRAGIPADAPPPPRRLELPADTSVDHDIDDQLAEAQRASDAENLLEKKG
jgi:small-conductance mechanosensitive channel